MLPLRAEKAALHRQCSYSVAHCAAKCCKVSMELVLDLEEPVTMIKDESYMASTGMLELAFVVVVVVVTTATAGERQRGPSSMRVLHL